MIVVCGKLVYAALTP
ncbi:hypothetical protein M2H12_21185 [Vibrio vulnificus]|nr:hypothetical protein [Vibrio vulnificus]MCU8168205.1 hypothetical protein [Vibrio vulnificus]MCU8308764.1 hypothetical protein [Vibrio vulnificus]